MPVRNLLQQQAAQEAVSHLVGKTFLGKVLPASVAATLLTPLIIDGGFKVIQLAGRAVTAPFSRKKPVEIPPVQQDELLARLEQLEKQVETQATEIKKLKAPSDSKKPAVPKKLTVPAASPKFGMRV